VRVYNCPLCDLRFASSGELEGHGRDDHCLPRLKTLAHGSPSAPAPRPADSDHHEDVLRLPW
jgi:hypothetical protein